MTARSFAHRTRRASKTKRLRNSPRVDVAPGTFRGRIAGAIIAAETRLLTGTDADVAARALPRQHPILRAFWWRSLAD